jgi:glucose/arabinose dehydrogenase
MLRFLPGLTLTAALIAAATLGVPAAASPPSLRPGFDDSLLASLPKPTALAFTPDGRLLVTSQPGVLRVIAGGSLLPTPALDLSASTCADGERGLLGVAVDPSFADNHLIYLYRTVASGGACVNRVSRFVLGDDNLVDPASEQPLLNSPSPGCCHEAGDLHFGNDGNLYVSVGDGGLGGRDRSVLLGKVLRITPSGGIPSDNPFLGPGTARCNLSGSTDPGTVCQETFAWGLRNPFRLAFDPNVAGTRLYINDVGENTWEEIDAGQSGADYGWNIREGFCTTGSTTDCGPPPAGMTNPLYAYQHANGCTAITAGAFVPNGVWPAEYDDAYLFADYLCGTVFELVPDGNGGYGATTFASGFGSGGPIDMIFGPYGQTQALYYTTYVNGGEVRRIASTSPPSPPAAPDTAIQSLVCKYYNPGGTTCADTDNNGGETTVLRYSISNADGAQFRVHYNDGSADTWRTLGASPADVWFDAFPTCAPQTIQVRATRTSDDAVDPTPATASIIIVPFGGCPPELPPPDTAIQSLVCKYHNPGGTTCADTDNNGGETTTLTYSITHADSAEYLVRYDGLPDQWRPLGPSPASVWFETFANDCDPQTVQVRAKRSSDGAVDPTPATAQITVIPFGGC